MFRRKRLASGYGIQILDHVIRVTGIRSVSKKIRLGLHETLSLPEGTIKDGKIIDKDALIRTLSEAVAALSLKHEHVVITIPTSGIILRRATFPIVKDRELRNLIDVELHGGGEQLPFKNATFDFIRMGRSEEGDEDEVLIFASPTDVIESYLEAISATGLHPVAVDLAPLALFRVLLKYAKTSGNDIQDSFILLNAESDHAEISIFVNGYPAFLRSIPVRSSMLSYDEEDSLKIYHRNLSTELGRIINYYKFSVATNPQLEIKQLYIIGTSHWTEGLAPHLNGVFEGSIEQVEVNDMMVDYDTEYNSYVVPIGLALRGV